MQLQLWEIRETILINDIEENHIPVKDVLQKAFDMWFKEWCYVIKDIKSKLQAEWVDFNDYDNVIKVLSKCVQWTKLITKYKEYE